MPTAVHNPAAHFWSRVDRSGGSHACWPWLGYVTPQGYGQTRIFGTRKITEAHRYAFMLVYGWVPEGRGKRDLLIRHRCDNRVCCNPDHLQVGTHRDNTADCIARGRFIVPARPIGLSAYRSKLSEDQVTEARRRFVAGATVDELAARFGVHRDTARRVVRGITYQDVPMPPAPERTNAEECR